MNPANPQEPLTEGVPVHTNGTEPPTPPTPMNSELFEFPQNFHTQVTLFVSHALSQLKCCLYLVCILALPSYGGMRPIFLERHTGRLCGVASTLLRTDPKKNLTPDAHNRAEPYLVPDYLVQLKYLWLVKSWVRNLGGRGP